MAFDGDENPCARCLKQAAAEGRECSSQAIDCGANAACAEVVICLAACAKSASPSCVSDCLYPLATDDAHQKYVAFLTCGCNSCGSFCAAFEPVSCAPIVYPDAGPLDAALDGEGLDAEEPNAAADDAADASLDGG